MSLCRVLKVIKKESKVVHFYSAFSMHMKMLKSALQWSVYPQRTGCIYTKRSMCAGTYFTDPGRMEGWVNFSGKEGHPNIQPSTRPGIEPGTSRLEGRDLYHCANPSPIRTNCTCFSYKNELFALLLSLHFLEHSSSIFILHFFDLVKLITTVFMCIDSTNRSFLQFWFL